MAEIPEPKTRLEQYWAGILDKIEGGGNPNYIERIEGTLDDPWGENFGNLYTEILNNDASAIIQIPSITTFKFPAMAIPDYEEGLDIIAFTSSTVSNKDVTSAVAIAYTSSGKFLLANAYAAKDGVFSIPDTTPCTITIIHHPLPNQS